VSILGIRKARSKPIDLMDLQAAGTSLEAVAPWSARLQLDALEPPPSGKEAEMLVGTPDEVALKFVAVLKEKGGVL
jgi:electron transfer flavoprotein alpha/beta subunit